MDLIRLAVSLLMLLSVCAFIAGCMNRPSTARPGAETREQQPERARVSERKDFSFGYWLNGWRKAPEDTSPDILCFETGRYGFMLDMNDLTRPRFGLLDDGASYERALAAGTQRLNSLPPAELTIELEHAGKVYRALACRPRSARMWESGRFVQHFDLLDLTFKDSAGQSLACYGTLDMVAWPGSLTFTAELAPDFDYVDGPCPGVVGSGHCIIEKPLDVPHRPELEPEKLTVECWVNIPEKMDRRLYGWLLCKNQHEWGKGNYGFMFQGGAATAVLNNTGGRNKQQAIRQNGKLSPGKWHHLALTYDGRTLRYYVDGHPQGSQAIGSRREPGNGLLRIGKRADGNFAVVNGLYDQVRVWSRALSPAEIRGHAAKPAEIANRDGLVFEENFDGGRGFKVPVWNDATLRVRFRNADLEWQDEKLVRGAWRMGEKKSLTLNCNLGEAKLADRKVTIQVSTPDGQAFPVRFDPTKNCYVAEVKGLKRSFRGGWVKITDYDEFDILMDCDEGAAGPVPFLLDLRRPANITGLVPILCHSDGTPTGVPVQLSKNWHYRPLGAYLRAYALVPVKRGQNHYRVRIVYGFYGTLPSASHAQLCLIGYGGNQRWDQLALACGGEAITFDADMSLTNVAVCDVRLPLGRNGEDGNPWGWSDAGWGGDWLGLFHDDWKLAFAGMKTAYLSHGPCLSDVLYNGAYGSQREALLEARVQFPRSDDYGRTFQKLKYQFQQELDAANSYLMRRHARAFDTVVAYGNAEGLIAEKRVTEALKKGDFLVPATEIEGPGPWWIAFPGRTRRGQKDWGFGYVSIIIRRFEASFGGKSFTNPFFQARVEQVQDGEAKLETWVVPPPGVRAYRPGDWVALDAEWLHLHRNAADYGGPNDAYRKHLEENPQSWKTTYREVKGNHLEIEVEGGTLLEELPIVVHADQREVTVTIRGGVGHVPIRFEGLKKPDGYALYEMLNGEQKKLDQSAHGNDFWQTDADASTGTWKMTFNLPVEGRASSKWILKPR